MMAPTAITFADVLVALVVLVCVVVIVFMSAVDMMLEARERTAGRPRRRPGGVL